ncbi:MAG: RNA polymerase sigma factor [Planctomycetota bacterium]
MKRPGGDYELARRSLAGDAGARELLGRRLGCIGRMLAARNRRMASPLTDEQLEDVGSDVALHAWSRLREFRGGAALESWLFRFCEFTLRNAMRRRERERSRQGELGDLASDQGSAADRDRVRRALGRLHPDELDAVQCHHFDGLTFDEIAARSGAPVSTIKGRYYRAMERLRWWLGPYEGGEQE